jgi:hypothetical protein
MIDGNVWRGDEHRLGMRERIETVFAVVVPDAGGSGAPEGHGLDKQVNIHEVHPASAEGELADEPIDGFLVAAEDEARAAVHQVPPTPPPQALTAGLKTSSLTLDTCRHGAGLPNPRIIRQVRQIGIPNST